MGSRLPATASSLLALGTHSATLLITDPTGKQASTSWKFTVGVAPTATTPIPDDAKVVASIPLVLDGGAKTPGGVSLTVVVHETPDGRRFLEYVARVGKDGQTVKSRDPFWVRRFVNSVRNADPMTLTVFPKTLFAFPTNELKFRSAYEGPGTVAGIKWAFRDGTAITESSEPEYTYKIGREILSVTCTADVADTLPDGTTSHAYVQNLHDVRPIIPATNIIQRAGFTTFATGTVALDGERTLFFREIVEGSTVIAAATTDGPQGRVLVVKSRWVQIAGDSTQTIEDPTATMTRVIYTKPGYIEVAHEIVLELDWETEHYVSNYQTEATALNGLFRVSAAVSYGKIPPGILFGTSRIFDVNSITLKINGESREFHDTAGLNLPEPWVLARSEMFPASNPIRVTKIIPGAEADDHGFAGVPKDFQVQVWHYEDIPEGESIRVHSTAEFKTKDFSTTFVDNIQPIGDSVALTPYPVNAELITIDIAPPGPTQVAQGQKLRLNATIVPKPGMGTGHITAKENTLLLLDGYEATEVSNLLWIEEFIGGDRPKGKSNKADIVDWFYDFLGVQGTGTYDVNVSAVVAVREKTTQEESSVAGDSKTEVEVTPGFQITSPFDTFVYPKGARVEIRTTLDDQLEEWAKIKWTVNGKAWKPEETKPPAILLLDGTAKDWSLVGTWQPTQGSAIEAKVSFTVQPVELAISPQRRVFEFKSGIEVPLKLSVKLAGQNVTAVGQSVPWMSDLLTAQVTDIKWAGVAASKESASVSGDNGDPFAATAKFSDVGALTALATITLQIDLSGKASDTARFKRSGRRKDESHSSLVFTINATRADLWTCSKSSEWVATGTLPINAIAGAKRTFIVNAINGKMDGIPFSSTTRTTSPAILTLAPAVSGISPAIADNVLFSWKGPYGQVGDREKFAAEFVDAGQSTVEFAPSLKFGDDGVIALGSKSIPISVSRLQDLVDAKIDPEDVITTVGETQTFAVNIAPKQQPNITLRNSFELLGGAYTLVLLDVEWTIDGVPAKRPSRALTYDLTPSSSGDHHVFARAIVGLTEKLSTEVSRASLNLAALDHAHLPTITYLVNGSPLGSKTQYLGEKVTLSFRAENHNHQPFTKIDHWAWAVGEPLVSTFLIAEHQDSGGAWPSAALYDTMPSFILYDYGEHAASKAVSLQYSIKSNPLKFQGPDETLSYVRPTIISPRFSQVPPVIYFQPPDDPPSSENATPAWRLGYPGKPTYCAMEPEVSNMTDVDYSFAHVQLIWIRDARQKAGNAQFADWDDWALDTRFPYGGATNTQPIEAHTGSKILTRLFNDSPSSWLSWASMPTDVTHYNANWTGAVFLMTKPKLPDSEWVPCKYYEWTWKASAANIGTASWALDDDPVPSTGLTKPPVEKPLSEIANVFRYGFPCWTWKTITNTPLAWRNHP